MELVSQDYWWPQLWKYVKEFVGSCDVCALIKNPHYHPHGLFQSLPIHASPWSSISMDFIIDLPPSNSYDSILVVVDHLKKKVHFILCTKAIEDQAMWLADVRTQLVFNFKEVQRRYKENAGEH